MENVSSFDSYVYNRYHVNEGVGDYDWSNQRGRWDKEKFIKDNLYKPNPKQEYVIGDIVIYLGNTQDKRDEEGVVERLREDGKVVVRFDDNKLIAIRKERLVLKPDDDVKKGLSDIFEEERVKWLETEKKRLEEEERRRREYERMQREREEAERKRRAEEERLYKEAEKKRLEEIQKNPGKAEKWWERNKKTGFE